MRREVLGWTRVKWSTLQQSDTFTMQYKSVLLNLFWCRQNSQCLNGWQMTNLDCKFLGKPAGESIQTTSSERLIENFVQKLRQRKSRNQSAPHLSLHWDRTRVFEKKFVKLYKLQLMLKTPCKTLKIIFWSKTRLPVVVSVSNKMYKCDFTKKTYLM